MSTRVNTNHKANTACKMYYQGYTICEIVESTGLSAQMVQKVIAESKLQAMTQAENQRAALICEELQRVQTVENQYWQEIGKLADEKPDYRLLQGLERCIELRITLLGLNDKKGFAAPAAEDPSENRNLDLSSLSETTLKELRTIQTESTNALE